ncbi:MAG: hypothetical protein ACJ76N_31445 [Thermoanaerobaculia bacterium]
MDERIFWNGIDGRHGGYLFTPSRTAELAALVKESSDSQVQPLRRSTPLRQELWARRGVVFGAQRRPRTQAVRFGGLIYGIDPEDLGQAGWAAIFPQTGDPAVQEALWPLLELRRKEAAMSSERRFRVLAGADGYRAGELPLTFLERQGVGPGPVDPDKLPYYLLLVGGAREIPFEFQYQLASQYAVGRLASESPEEYARYAAGLVALANGRTRLPRQAAFFGVWHADDPATQDSSTRLVAPLAAALRRKCPACEVQTILGEEATKARLARLLGGDETPSLLFTASHGLGFPCGDPLQRELQGAIICNDWPGPEDWPHEEPIPPEHIFAAADIGTHARLNGLILFLYACFGAGTPRRNGFAKRENRPSHALAPEAFVARLPQRLLGHPNGTAVAVIGHVDRTWGSSFLWKRAGQQLQAFESALRALLDGRRVGWAMDGFSLRRGELAAALNAELEHETGDPLRLPGLWTAHNDARSFAILGDPAARLP